MRCNSPSISELESCHLVSPLEHRARSEGMSIMSWWVGCKYKNQTWRNNASMLCKGPRCILRPWFLSCDLAGGHELAEVRLKRIRIHVLCCSVGVHCVIPIPRLLHTGAGKDHECCWGSPHRLQRLMAQTLVLEPCPSLRFHGPSLGMMWSFTSALGHHLGVQAVMASPGLYVHGLQGLKRTPPLECFSG